MGGSSSEPQGAVQAVDGTELTAFSGMFFVEMTASRVIAAGPPNGQSVTGGQTGQRIRKTAGTSPAARLTKCARLTSARPAAPSSAPIAPSPRRPPPSRVGPIRKRAQSRGLTEGEVPGAASWGGRGSPIMYGTGSGDPLERSKPASHSYSSPPSSRPIASSSSGV